MTKKGAAREKGKFLGEGSGCFFKKVKPLLEREKGREKWTRRELNPRPNEETVRFLHAYCRLDFRATESPARPTEALSPIDSSMRRGPQGLSPIYLHHHYQALRGQSSWGDVSFRPPWVGIKPIYYASIRQRERSCFRQLNCFEAEIKVPASLHCMLTHHSCPLSNPVWPKLLYKRGSLVRKSSFSKPKGQVFRLKPL